MTKATPVIGKLSKLEDGLADEDESLEADVALEDHDFEEELVDEEAVDDTSDVEVVLDDIELVYEVVCPVEVLESSEEPELICPTVVVESTEVELD